MKNFIIFCLSAFILASCSQKESFEGPKDGLVEVQIKLPQYYAHSSNASKTKASPDVAGQLPSQNIEDLENGSTLWLTYERKIGENNYETPVLKSYVVRSSGAGYQALYACENSIIDGKMVVNAENASTTATPLYLKHNETYRFRMISPAMPISATDLSMNIDNGDSFCSSDERYDQTKSKDTQITANTSGVNYISLNPMIQQTARISFKLKKGNNVSSIVMMGNGIEITGIQDPYAHGEGGNKYNWSSLDASDTLVMRLGDKRAWVTLPGEKFTETPDGALAGSVCILPTDARSNTVTMLLNMSVNGVPTQYITTLNGMIFEHAKSYNLTFTVSLQNNIVVVNWQNTSWTADI